MENNKNGRDIAKDVEEARIRYNRAKEVLETIRADMERLDDMWSEADLLAAIEDKEAEEANFGQLVKLWAFLENNEDA